MNWINALLFGALFVGPNDDEISAKYKNFGIFLNENRYGILIHSLIISGWEKYDLETFFTGRIMLETSPHIEFKLT